MNIKEMNGSTFTSEAGHWYTKDGSPAYTVEGKNGTRPITLRDARKLGLVPSVTTVLKVLANFGIIRYRENQLLDAALTLPEINGETMDERRLRILIDADEHRKTAMQAGTSIHHSLECSFMGLLFPPEHSVYVDAVRDKLDEVFGQESWIAEKSFAHPIGFGGKIDLCSTIAVLDYKTKEFDEDTPISKLIWPEQAMQLAAYKYGTNNKGACIANIFVSTSNPGLVKLHIWDEYEYHRDKFLTILEYWKMDKRYNP